MPAPPTKAIAHPFFRPFSAGDFWRPDVRARPRPRLPAGTRRPLAKCCPIPSPADEHREPPHQGYSPPIFLAFFRRGLLEPRPSGAYFWARL